LLIFSGVQGVTDALSAEQIERATDRLGTDGFSGVRGESQAVASGALVDSFEEIGGRLTLVSADADTDDIA
jgi:hypothetical protein